MNRTYSTRQPSAFEKVGEDAHLVSTFFTSSRIQEQGQIPDDIYVAPINVGERCVVDTRPAFLPVKEDPIKAAFMVWRKDGVVEALQMISEAYKGESRKKNVMCLASLILNCISQVQAVCRLFQSPHCGDPRQLCEAHAHVNDWSNSVIRAFSLHPSLSLLAVASQDDVIQLKGYHGHGQGLLWDRRQKSITCMEWAPFSKNLLAVGVENGIVVWHVDPESSSTGASCVFLEDVVSLPVTCLSWCPKGQFLAAGSPAESAMCVWEISLLFCTKMIRKQGGGLVQVSWSPDGCRVLAANSTHIFRVWEPGASWQCERWTNLSGHCKAACWSPNSDLLLFALSEDPSLYCLGFGLHYQPNDTGGSNVAVKVLDLSPSTQSSDAGKPLGGCVQSMVWDSSGRRLAVLFTHNSPGANRVAVFQTRCSPALQLFPGGYLQGQEDELPILVEFSPIHPMLLAICWSSGRISFSSVAAPLVAVHPPQDPMPPSQPTIPACQPTVLPGPLVAIRPPQDTVPLSQPTTGIPPSQPTTGIPPSQPTTSIPPSQPTTSIPPSRS